MADNNSEKDENDYTSYQCHGDHLDCVLDSFKDELGKMINTAIQDSSLYGQTETSFNLGDDETKFGKVAVLEYSSGEKDPIIFRSCIACLKDSNQLVSLYPLVKEGVRLPVKITEIKEWTNGLEAWVTGEIPDDRMICFFDTDYSLNKDKYKVGDTYDFIIGALAYHAEEMKSKGFDLEGQKAIDFKAKIGEAPEYDEKGNVLPVHFSTEKLCAFIQFVKGAPDEAEFITTVDSVSEISSLGKTYYHFDIKLNSNDEDDDHISIPCYVKKNDETKEIVHAPQIQGYLWITGYMA